MKLRGSIGEGGDNYPDDLARFKLAMRFTSRPTGLPACMRRVNYWSGKWDLGGLYSSGVGTLIQFMCFDRRLRERTLIMPNDPLMPVIAAGYARAPEKMRARIEAGGDIKAGEDIQDDDEDTKNPQVTPSPKKEKVLHKGNFEEVTREKVFTAALPKGHGYKMLEIDINALSNSTSAGTLFPGGFIIKRISKTLGKLANTRVTKPAGNGVFVTIRQGPKGIIEYEDEILVDHGSPIRTLIEIHPTDIITLSVQGITFSPVALRVRALNYFTPAMYGE